MLFVYVSEYDLSIENETKKRYKWKTDLCRMETQSNVFMIRLTVTICKSQLFSEILSFDIGGAENEMIHQDMLIHTPALALFSHLFTVCYATIMWLCVIILGWFVKWIRWCCRWISPCLFFLSFVHAFVEHRTFALDVSIFFSLSFDSLFFIQVYYFLQSVVCYLWYGLHAKVVNIVCLRLMLYSCL